MLYHCSILNLHVFMQDFKFVILWVEEQALAWEHFLFPRFGRSTQIAWCWHFPFFLHQRCPTQLSNLTMPPFLCISLLRMLMNAWSSTMRPFTTSASVLWSLPPLLVSPKYSSLDFETYCRLTLKISHCYYIATIMCIRNYEAENNMIMSFIIYLDQYQWLSIIIY